MPFIYKNGMEICKLGMVFDRRAELFLVYLKRQMTRLGTSINCSLAPLHVFGS
eukprot:c11838_g1_i1 orf=293-451(+)